ncbi:MAG: response regulator [Algicola sp.]|nr:response regulator [Algicola sp.]
MNLTETFAADSGCDLALVDWSMPGLNGVETLAKLDMPSLLMVSAYERDAVGDTAALLEKPVSHASVYAAIMQLHTGKAIMVDESANVAIPDLSGNHILLVDDNAINRQVALGFLADTGVRVDVAENGLIALASIRQQTYDLVLMDIEMPQMDGMTATGEIRDTLGLTQLPVIAMTAHAMASDIEKTKAAGMNDHVTKPVDPAMLYQCLAKFLETGQGAALSVSQQRRQSPPLQPESSLSLEQAHEVLLAQLAKVDGLDSQKAVTKLNGRTALYLGLVKDFSLQQQPRTQERSENHLMTLYDQQSWDELYRSVHSLKANAAYIGAFELSQLAGIVETALAQGAVNGKGYSDKALLQGLCDVLLPIVDQLKEIHFEQPVVDNEVIFSEQRLYDLLTQALPLLKASSFSVEAHLPAIVALCQGSEYADKITQLVHLVDDLEFEKAAELARLLREELPR